MNRKTKSAVALVGVVGLVLTLGAFRPALPPRDPARPAQFTVNQIATQQSSGFIATGQFLPGDEQILDGSLNFAPDPYLGVVPAPSQIVMYQHTSSGWTPHTVVGTDQNILNPNQPQVADVNGDGRPDFILPAGWFYNEVNGVNTGSLTWWENNGNGTFTRHNIATNVDGSYEGAIFVDLNNSGHPGILTTLEDGGNPFVDPAVPAHNTMQYFPGLGNGRFGAPINLCNCGGPLPQVFDVNHDGHLDIMAAQFLTVGTQADPANGISDESFIWLENTGRSGAPLTSTTFVKHVIAHGLGESLAIYPVDNLDGNGQYGFIGVNTVNPYVDSPPVQPQVFRFTPGPDIRAPWNVSVVANNFTLAATYPGNAAPGNVAEGDLDGDGDIDLAVAGGNDNGIYFIERTGTGAWVQHDLRTLTGNAGADWGNSGVKIADLYHNGRNEIIFSSYDANGLFIATRTPGTGGILPAVPHIPDALQPYTAS